jgi:hypothetical protein
MIDGDFLDEEMIRWACLGVNFHSHFDASVQSRSRVHATGRRVRLA